MPKNARPAKTPPIPASPEPGEPDARSKLAASPYALDAGAVPARKSAAAAKPRRGYAGRSAEQLRIERMNRLTDAALTLFSERGYAKTPIELICARAKVTTRHFYEQYEGREDLLAQLYQQIVSGARTAIFAALQKPADGVPQRMYAAIHAFIRSYTDDPRRARVACIEVIGVSEELSQMRRKMVNDFAVILESFAKSLARDGALPSRDYRLGAICMVGGTNEIMTEWLTSTNPPSVPQLAEQLLRFYSALFAGARLLGDRTPGFNLDAVA